MPFGASCEPSRLSVDPVPDAFAVYCRTLLRQNRKVPGPKIKWWMRDFVGFRRHEKSGPFVPTLRSDLVLIDHWRIWDFDIAMTSRARRKSPARKSRQANKRRIKRIYCCRTTQFRFFKRQICSREKQILMIFAVYEGNDRDSDHQERH